MTVSGKDYLQVFEILCNDGRINSIDSQEVMPYSKEYRINIDFDCDGEYRVYVIDGGEYVKMLLTEKILGNVDII